MGKNGQSLIEFVVIIAVVVLGGIMVLTLLGDNINTMFFKSEQKVASFQPFGDPSTSSSTTTSTSTTTTPSTTTSSTTTPSTTTTTTPSTATMTVNGVDVNVNTDGSASFNYSGQDILLSSTMMDNLNIVSESTGADGITVEVMSAIQKLIDDHKAEYAPADVPVELTFGKGTRSAGGEYLGDVTYNQVQASVSGHKIFIQNDQDISGGATADKMGIHSVEMFTTQPNGGGTAKVISSTSNLLGKTLTFGDYQNATFDDTTFGAGWNFPPLTTPTSI